jgi:crotonobetainyl-CoA:carnitine CoA-transferase CaiB-like acyl-CoA transferase
MKNESNQLLTNQLCKGLKVLDLSGILAGPLVASFFAELGAEVIKVENKLTGGDATRQWKLPAEKKEATFSAYYHSANYGKKVLMKNMTDAKDRSDVEKIMSESDIVISNFQKKTAQKLSFVPEEIIQKYPGIIFAQLSAYTWDDPRPGYDLVMQGETGWISMNGTDSEHISKIPVAVIDIFAAHQMKEAILLAMWKKAITHKGSVIHVSLYKSAISGLANQASNYLNANHVPKPIGTLHPNIAPYGDLFTSKDNIKFLLAVGSDDQFKKLWFTLNMDQTAYPNFEKNSDRVKTRSALQQIMQQIMSKLRFSEIEQKICAINIPFCKILNLNEVFENPLAQDMVLQNETIESSKYYISNVAFELINDSAGQRTI